jgi:23S rRNA (adenine-N6)-dimethyltransferase
LLQLKRTDFWPVPNVDSVLLSIKRRTSPLIEPHEVAPYREFVQYGFGRWKPNLKLAFKNVFTYKQWKRLSRDLDFPLNATPTELGVKQWLGLYQAFRCRTLSSRDLDVGSVSEKLPLSRDWGYSSSVTTHRKRN